MNLILTNNTEQGQYETEVEGQTSRVEYSIVEGKIYLTYAKVPTEMQGQGIGSALVDLVLQDIEKQNLTVIPTCSFIVSYLRAHPKWKKLTKK